MFRDVKSRRRKLATQKKELRVSFKILVENDVNPLTVEKEITSFIEQKGWKTLGIGIKYPSSDDELVAEEIRKIQEENERLALGKLK